MSLMRNLCILLLCLIHTVTFSQTLWHSDAFSLYADSLVQPGEGKAWALSRTTITSTYPGLDSGQWSLSRDISAFPANHSPYMLPDALYNMALEEMQKAIEPDSTFRTGKEWAGVWTRDISYSILLSMAFLQPEVARHSLMRKVSKEGRIIQDTGTGGAWPVSSDRMIWAVAAWELYKVTGDRDWLEKAYGVVKRSMDDDARTLYDPSTGLVRGESSFLDWREQTYPAWMQPADIFSSENLGTNAVHYQANRVLAAMARRLGHAGVAAEHEAIAARIRAGVNRYLWMPGVGSYGQYRYGRIYPVLSPRTEALGSALSVIFGIAPVERARQLVCDAPLMAFGIPCIYPQIPDIPPYHNNAVWPFVQTFWLWACDKTANEGAALASIADIYRPAALFLTNKENFVASTGDFKGTQINSSNMLWSLSGNLSIVYKVLFGMRFEPDTLDFSPFVPKALRGTRTLRGVHYRAALLDITMSGYGNRVRSFLLDGRPQSFPRIPAALAGRHSLKIILASSELPVQTIRHAPPSTSPAAPVAYLSGDSLTWGTVAGAKAYLIYRNGQRVARTTGTSCKVAPQSLYQVLAQDAHGVSSFLSEPVLTALSSWDFAVAEGIVDLTRDANQVIRIPFESHTKGTYAIDFHYSNGNGPINTENKCAIRNLSVDGRPAGVLVFPQRGKDDWSSWGYSSNAILNLIPGKHELVLSFETNDENMNGGINEAKVDRVRLILLPNPPTPP